VSERMIIRHIDPVPAEFPLPTLGRERRSAAPTVSGTRAAESPNRVMTAVFTDPSFTGRHLTGSSMST